MLKYAQRPADVWGIGGTDSHIPILDTGWRSAICFRFLLFYLRGKEPGTSCAEDCMGLRTGLDVVAKINILPFRESNQIIQPLT